VMINTASECKDGEYYNRRNAGNSSASWLTNRCVDCPAGTYANNDEGVVINQCRECPDLSYSTVKSKFCPFCAKGHYTDSIASDKKNNTLIHMHSDEYCKKCPTGAPLCDTPNTYLQNITVEKGFWREFVSSITLQAFTSAEMKTYATVWIIRSPNSIARKVIAQLTILALYARCALKRVGPTSVKILASACFAHHLEMFFLQYFGNCWF
jgi:hypothetical protein